MFWLVGYGLDSDCKEPERREDNQQLRGLGFLWAKPKGDGLPNTPNDEMFANRHAAAAYVGNIKRNILISN